MVKITAIASTTNCGDAAALAASVEARESNFDVLTVELGDSVESFLASKAQEPNCPASLSPKVWKRWDRGSKFASSTANDLWLQRSRELSSIERARTAIIVGCGISGMETLDPAFRRFYHEAQASLPPLTIPKAMPSAIASAVAETLQITGPAFTVSAACASGIHAIMLAKSMIDSGMVDRAVVGAVEVSLEPGALLAWRALRVLSDEPMIPFSSLRSGINLAEGAAFMLIESDNAASDWVRPSNRIIAAHASTGGWHLTRPDVKIMADLMKKACEIANRPLSDISHLNSHGTGTVANNECESSAIRSVFASHEAFPEISATKTYHGHMLAASAAVETVLLLYMVRNKMTIPIINTTSTSNPFFPRPPLCRMENPRLLMKTAYGFGGTNGCLILQMDDA